MASGGVSHYRHRVMQSRGPMDATTLPRSVRQINRRAPTDDTATIDPNKTAKGYIHDTENASTTSDQQRMMHIYAVNLPDAVTLRGTNV